MGAAGEAGEERQRVKGGIWQVIMWLLIVLLIVIVVKIVRIDDSVNEERQKHLIQR